VKQAQAKPTTGETTRIKCACARCSCMLDSERAVRKGNLMFCGEICSTKCTPDKCICGHDTCSL
jgi:hypothetical protein